MKKIKEFFESIIEIFEGLILIIILVFGYPFYKKPLKEMWKSFIEHRNKDRDGY